MPEKISLYLWLALVVCSSFLPLNGRAAVLEENKIPNGKILPSKFFDKQMMFVDELYVLHDVIEFSVFDISEVDILDEAGAAKVELTEVENSKQNPEKWQGQWNSKEEVESLLNDIPKFFYKSLKQEILKQNVPATLFSKDPPSYAKPIKLAIKIKKIHLLPHIINEEGQYIQPVQMKIYGQIKDKKTEAVLTRFYDSATGSFVLGLDKEFLEIELEKMSSRLMRDLAGFFKTQY